MACRARGSFRLTDMAYGFTPATASASTLVKCTTMPNDAIYIDTPSALTALCERLTGAKWLALDTEFHREKTYYPEFCLLQLATADFVACVDPLALKDLGPLLAILDCPDVIKVFHAARQDLEIFYHLTNRVPGPIFDTQLAAPLLGHPDQMGYGALVHAVLGVSLGKGHARADWSRRPLPHKQLEYALDDVRYLAKLYPRLREELASRNRLHWLDEEFAALTDTGAYSNPPAAAWRRIRGTDRLRAPQLAVLQHLAAWREQTAQQENRPRNWLIRDDILLDIARQLPTSKTDLEHIRGLNERLLHKQGEKLLQIVASARTATPDPLPASSAPVRLEQDQDALVDALMALVRLRAAEQQLNASVLVSRKDLERMVAGRRDLTILRGWKKSMVGQELLAMLEGEISLQVCNGRLSVGTTTG